MKNKYFYFFLILLFNVWCGYSQVLIAAVFGDKLNSPDLDFRLE